MNKPKYGGIDGIKRVPAKGKAPPSKKPDIVDIWSDQLQVRRRDAVERMRRQAERTAKTIEIKISLPNLPALPSKAKIKRAARKISPKTYAIIAAVILLFAVFYQVTAPPNSNGAGGKAASKNQAALPDAPGYDTLLPAGKTISQLGGWSRVSPPDRNPVYAYADKIDGVPISVSQQPLPGDFEQDTDTKVAQLAQQYNAGQKITVNKTTVYIGSSAPGPQSVIFTKDKLLILIRSNTKISANKWAAYINTLQ